MPTWKDLEGFMQSEICKEKQILYDPTYRRYHTKKKPQPKKRSDLWSPEGELNKGGQKV